MVDNFNIFAPWFDNLSDQGDFYFVQVIQRKKECNIGSNNNVIKDYHFFDKKSFLNKKEEIVTLCKTFNARAYFWVNPRNCKQVQYEIIREALKSYLNVFLKQQVKEEILIINLNGYQILILKIGVL